MVPLETYNRFHSMLIGPAAARSCCDSFANGATLFMPSSYRNGAVEQVRKGRTAWCGPAQLLSRSLSHSPSLSSHLSLSLPSSLTLSLTLSHKVTGFLQFANFVLPMLEPRKSTLQPTDTS